jgi:hypothetical protein
MNLLEESKKRKEIRIDKYFGGVGELLLAGMRNEVPLALQQLATERNAQVRQVGLARR